MQKRGVFDLSPSIVISLIATALFIITAIVIANAFDFEKLFSTKKQDCQNEVEWGSLKKTFDKLESDSKEEAVFFYNAGCNLVSFSQNLGIKEGDIKPDFNPEGKPRICLCKIEGGLCKPYDCYKFSKFTEVKSEEDTQFSTFDKAEYAYLKFETKEKSLIVKGIVQEKKQAIKEKAIGFGQKILSQIDLQRTFGICSENEKEYVTNNIVSMNFLGKIIYVNKKLEPIFIKIAKEIQDSGVNYEIKSVGGYNCRQNVNNREDMSAHAFGAAIDINGDENPNMKRSNPNDICRSDIPQKIVEIFKSSGFCWGGQFTNICDPMHFEYCGDLKEV